MGKAKDLIFVMEKSAREDLIQDNKAFASILDKLIPVMKKVKLEDKAKAKNLKQINKSLVFLKNSTIDVDKGLSEFSKGGLVTRDKFLKLLEKPLGSLFSFFEDVERLWKEIKLTVPSESLAIIGQLLSKLRTDGNSIFNAVKVLGVKL